MQELGKLNLPLNVIPNGLGKYMSFTIKDKLVFLNSSQYLHSTLESLVKNLAKGDLKCSNQEFDKKVLDLVKQKVFHPYEYMSDFEKFKKYGLAKKGYRSAEKLLAKNMNMFLLFGIYLKWKQWKIITTYI